MFIFIEMGYPFKGDVTVNNLFLPIYVVGVGIGLAGNKGCATTGSSESPVAGRSAGGWLLLGNVG